MNPRLFRGLRQISRRLFFKIFFAFWLAMTAAGIILLGVETTRNARMAQRWRGVTADAFAVYAASAARDYQSNSESRPVSPTDGQSLQPRTLSEFLADLEERTRIRAWVFDASGREVSGYASAQRKLHPLWLQNRINQMVKSARTSGQTEFADLEGLTLAARAALTPSGQRWVLVGTLQDARYDFWGAAPRIQLLRFLAILATAGAVSWLLARHLTQPLDLLRNMARKLAAGDFSARADIKLDRRRDELAELAGDFNSMATRIERLLSEQERLLVAQRHLLADVAHELRSPLARSSVALELARDAMDPEITHSQDLTPVRESLNRIERETGNLTELIDRLLMISRMESGMQTPERTKVDLAGLVRAVVADANFEAQSRQRTVRLVASEPCTTIGTSLLLRSAIENVVRNAVRHTPENTTVEVSLSRKDAIIERWQTVGKQHDCFTSNPPIPNPSAFSSANLVSSVVITVRDRGSGVPVEELSEIFQPFYRAGSGRARESGGAGLGLTITARAVELHGGQYRICNLPQSGLEVQLRLPVLADNE